MQLHLDLPAQLPRSVYDVGQRSSGESHGVVLTKPHIVELILDLAGYTEERDLGSLALLEPACGQGAFLGPAVKRLLTSAEKHGRPFSSLGSAIHAFDIDSNHIEESRRVLANTLLQQGASQSEAADLVEQWVTEGDFLLSPLPRRFDVVVGNPPYVRIEQLNPELQIQYRRRFISLYDRADLYVAFIERSLSLLAPEGLLSFICADRWILNKYGRPLRQLITSNYQVRCYLDLHQASPFESDVIAYPSIFLIGRGEPSGVQVGKLSTASPDECRSMLGALRSHDPSISNFPTWFKKDEPWVLSSPNHLESLRDLESRFGSLAENDIQVGIGVATGNDSVFIVKAGTDIEPDRLVPLVMRDDIERGRIQNAGRFVINTFQDGGRVVDLESYPKLAAYLETQADAVRKRHVARKAPHAWFRTIDRVYPELVKKRKLLIPDIAGSNEVAFDEGKYHPHHNLYFIASDTWDLELLGGLLSSKVALFCVWSYGVKMRGGYLRFQAQYLRRIRIPAQETITKKQAGKIVQAFRERDFSSLDELALEVYNIQQLPLFTFVDTRQ